MRFQNAYTYRKHKKPPRHLWTNANYKALADEIQNLGNLFNEKSNISKHVHPRFIFAPV